MRNISDGNEEKPKYEVASNLCHQIDSMVAKISVKKSIENIEKLCPQAQSMVGDKIPGMGGAAAEAPAEGGEVPAEVRLHLHPHRYLCQRQ